MHPLSNPVSPIPMAIKYHASYIEANPQPVGHRYFPMRTYISSGPSSSCKRRINKVKEGWDAQVVKGQGETRCKYNLENDRSQRALPSQPAAATWSGRSHTHWPRSFLWLYTRSDYKRRFLFICTVCTNGPYLLLFSTLRSMSEEQTQTMELVLGLRNMYRCLNLARSRAIPILI